MKHLKSRDKIAAGEFCETSTLKGASSFIDGCRRMCEMGMVIGSPGAGKSTAIAYARTVFKNDTSSLKYPYNVRASFHLIEAAEAFSEQPRHFLEVMATELEAERGGASYAYQRFYQICTHLKNDASYSVIVVDEAQELGPRVLETLREIYDRTDVGIVLIGNVNFQGRFDTKKMDNYAHIASRITRRLPNIASVSDDDFRLSVVDYMGITNEKAVAALRPLKDGAGGLRHVARVVDEALDMVDDPSKVTGREVKDAILIKGLDA